MKQPARAAEAGGQAAATFNRLLERFGKEPDYQYHLARTLTEQSLALGQVGEHQKATDAVRKAIAIEESLVNAFPRVPGYMADLGEGYGVLGNLLRKDQPAEAEKYHREAVVLRERLVQRFP